MHLAEATADAESFVSVYSFHIVTAMPIQTGRRGDKETRR
jgi:hypothetical protein